MKIKILKSSFKNNYITLLLNKLPFTYFIYFIYNKINDYYYAKFEGFASLYEYKHGETKSFGGEPIELTLKSGKQVFEGSLFDPITSPFDVISIKYTTDLEAYKRDYTLISGYVTKQKYNQISNELLVDQWVERYQKGGN